MTILYAEFYMPLITADGRTEEREIKVEWHKHLSGTTASGYAVTVVYPERKLSAPYEGCVQTETVFETEDLWKALRRALRLFEEYVRESDASLKAASPRRPRAGEGGQVSTVTLFEQLVREDNRRVLAEARHLLDGNLSPTPIAYGRVEQALRNPSPWVHVYLLLAEVYGLTPQKARALYKSLPPVQQRSLDNGLIGTIAKGGAK